MVDGVGFGIGLGAAAQQISDISRRGIAERSVALQERTLDFQIRSQQRDQVLTTSAQLSQGIIDRKKAFGGTSEEFAQRIGGSIEGAASMLDTLTQNARNAGLDVPDLGAQFRLALENTPTRGEAAVTEGAATGTQQLAQAETLALGGIPTSQALEAAGVPAADVLKFQTDIGKLFSDLDIANSRFGENSPQSLAIKEVIQAKQSGEAPSLSDVAGIRKEFTKASQNFIAVSEAFDRVKFAAENDSAAGDVALIFAFMKMLDPGSVVRESEFATAEQAQGVPARIITMYNRAIDGVRLAPETRADFFNQTKGIFSNELRRQIDRETEYSRVASEAGFPVGQVIMNFRQGLGPEDIQFLGSPAGQMKRTGSVQPSGLTQPDIEFLNREDLLDLPIDEFRRAIQRLSPEGRRQAFERFQEAQ